MKIQVLSYPGRCACSLRAISWRTASRSAQAGQGHRAHRSDRLLGFHRQRRLALPHDRGAQGRFRRRALESSRPEGRQGMGSGQGRSRRQSMQGLRRGWSDAHTHAPAHHLAGRQHAQDRSGCRNANASSALRPSATTQRSADSAGLFGGCNGTDRSVASDISERLSIPPRAARSK